MGLFVELKAKNSDLEGLSFEDQLEKFFETGATYSDYFSRSMRDLGHEVFEVIYDFESAQKVWAQANNVSFNEKNWQIEIMLAQIELFCPDIVYLHSLVATPPKFAQLIRRQFPNLKSIVAYGGTPFPAWQAEGVDLLMVGMPHMCQEYKQKGVNTHLVYHGFDVTLLEKLKKYQSAGDERYLFTFLGSSGFGCQDFFVRRYWLLVELMLRCGLKGWINENAIDYAEIHNYDWFTIEPLLPMLRKQVMSEKSVEHMLFYTTKMLSVMDLPEEVMENYRRIYDAKREVDPATPLLPLRLLVPESCMDPIFGMEMYDLLQRSDITLNIHSDLSLGETVNMRMFEATGAGTCLITDYYKNLTPNQNDNIRDLFEPDSEVLTFSSIDECIERVQYINEHPKERLKIAAAGQARTLRDHTVEKRCEQIDALMQEFV